jgi:hypothetical protein
MSLSAPITDRTDLNQAIDFALGFFRHWQDAGRIRPQALAVVQQYYAGQRKALDAGELADDFSLRPADLCWSCKSAVGPDETVCAECGAPARSEKVRRLRYLIFLCHELIKHEKAGRVPLASSHELMTECNERIAALRRNLELERVPMVVAAAEPTPATALPAVPEGAPPPPRKKHPPAEVEPAGPQRSVLEILLDPRSIQWLLAAGGALLVLGGIIYLVAQGLLENKLFVAGLLGGGNALLLAAGWALVLGTRYQTAGRALALLACLVMPLNLWFYDAQGLIPLKEGGHLWIPAVVCCVLYAVSARVLRDPMLVHVLVLGMAATGLLILADSQLNAFWEVPAPATLLVVLGLIAIHVERVFPEGEGPFTRQGFGRAFFNAGHFVMAAGLLLVLAAQLAGGWLYEVVRPLLDELGFGRPQIVTEQWGQLWALALVAAATYAYLYSDLVVRRTGLYISLAVCTLLWAEVLAINLFHWPLPPLEMVIVVLGVTALIANLGMVALAPSNEAGRRAGPSLALILSTVPVLLGMLLHFRATAPALAPWSYTLTWTYVWAMLVTAVSCRIGAFLYRHRWPALSVVYFFGTAAATLLTVAALLVVQFHITTWEGQAPVLILVPIVYVLAAWLSRGHSQERPLIWVAHAATAVMLISSLGTAARGFVLVQGEPLNLTLALFFTEAALFYLLAAVIRGEEGSVYLCTAMVCAACWQVLKFAHVADEYYVLAFAITGLVLLIGYRFAVLESYGSKLAAAAFYSANTLLSLAFVSGALLTLNELLTRQADRDLLITLLGILIGIGVVSLMLVRHQAWRRWYAFTVVGNAALIVLVLTFLGHLTYWQKLELVCLVLGTGLLVTGHAGWYREQDRHDDLVSLALVFGSLLIAIPLTLAVITGRVNYLTTPGMTPDTFHTLNEFGMLLAGLLLLGTGTMCRLRATTIMGSLMLVIYVLTLVLYIRLPEKLQTTAVYMMIFGGLFFGLGLLLSIYRERLLTLPERIRRREGVFRVLGWR